MVAMAQTPSNTLQSKNLRVTPTTLKKMLMALNECTEWGRVTILTTLADYKAQDVKESEHICERVSPQFQHVNPSVVLAAVKVVFLHMRAVNQDLAKQYLKKMAPPLGMFTVQLSCLNTDCSSYTGRFSTGSPICCSSKH